MFEAKPAASRPAAGGMSLPVYAIPGMTGVQLALDKKNQAHVPNTLQAISPIEFGNTPFIINMSCLYPTYVRGEAYLAAGQGGAAAAEFQKILDHSGLHGAFVLNNAKGVVHETLNDCGFDTCDGNVEPNLRS